MNEKCRCGFEKDHPKIIHECKYSKFGWFLFTILGLSAKPIKVKFKCSVCGQIVDVSNDPEILEKFVGR